MSKPPESAEMARSGTVEIGKSEEGLMDPVKKNRLKVWLIGLAAALVIVVGVIVLVVLLTNRDSDSPDEEELHGTTELPTEPPIVTSSTSTTTTSTQPPIDLTTLDPPTDPTISESTTPTQPPTDSTTPQSTTPTQPPTDSITQESTTPAQPPTVSTTQESTTPTQPPTDSTTTGLPEPTGPAISIDDVISGVFTPERFTGLWTSDTEYIYKNDDDSILRYNPINGDRTILLDANDPVLSEILPRVFDFEVSSDGSQIMLAWDYRKLYRHSYTARYSCVNLPVTPSDDNIVITTISPDEVLDPHLQLFVWGPTGNSLAFVYSNNIYYKLSVGSAVVQLTDDGQLGTLYNGIPDWVYEEEVFSSHKTLWFTNSGNYLAYGKFNDTNTRVMTIPYYGEPGEVEYQYTTQLQVRYPKAGTPNPIAQVWLVNLASPAYSQTQLDAPNSLEDPILAAVSVAGDSNVAVTWMNRVQNQAIIQFCSYAECSEIFLIEQENGWVDMMRPLIFNAAGTSFVTILPVDIGTDSWRQVVQYSENGDNNHWTRAVRTAEANTVSEILRWDEADQLIWYLATGVNDPAHQHLYNVDAEMNIECFTCGIQHSTGTQCLYNEATFSKEGGHITVTCSGPQIPEVYLYSKEGIKLGVLEENAEVADLLRNRTTFEIHKLSVPLGPGIVPAQVSLITPPNYDTSGNIKYPVLVNVYGGPDSSQVQDRWSIDWGSSLVSRYNIIVANIDGRGSGLQGNNNMFSLYKSLGTVEVDDQIEVTRYLQNQLNYIDANRTCIWGWSYGGYASALALARGGDVFRCAISVAPVTNWIYYDSIYTERYMGLPTENDNLDGYVSSSINKPEIASALSNKSFMLVHGTMDDNVHYQQAMMLARTLQQNDVFFTQMSYADEDHSLNGVRPHLYHALERFLKNNIL